MRGCNPLSPSAISQTARCGHRAPGILGAHSRLSSIQEGRPSEIYHNPLSPWVASFVGESNFIPIEDAQDLFPPNVKPETLIRKDSSKESQIMVRPENFSIFPASNAEQGNGVIEQTEL